MTTLDTPVSEANADFLMIKVSVTDALHASVIVLMTTRTIQITLTAHSCAEDTIGGHGSQTLLERGNHKSIAIQFSMREMMLDLMVNLIFLLTPKILNLSIFLMVRETLTTTTRQTKQSHRGVRIQWWHRRRG